MYINYNNLVVCRNKTSEWDMLRDKAGDNETFTKKSIYTAPYDKSEIDHCSFIRMIIYERIFIPLMKVILEVLMLYSS